MNRANYRPKEINELRTAVQLLQPTYTDYNGVQKPAYPATGDVIYCNFKSYGGTESTVNGVISYIDTALVTTWYRPDIKADCHVVVRSTGVEYEIMGEPENINMQNQYLKFKVIGVKGGA